MSPGWGEPSVSAGALIVGQRAHRRRVFVRSSIATKTSYNSASTLYDGKWRFFNTALRSDAENASYASQPWRVRSAASQQSLPAIGLPPRPTEELLAAWEGSFRSPISAVIPTGRASGSGRRAASSAVRARTVLADSLDSGLPTTSSCLATSCTCGLPRQGWWISREAMRPPVAESTRRTGRPHKTSCAFGRRR